VLTRWLCVQVADGRALELIVNHITWRASVSAPRGVDPLPSAFRHVGGARRRRPPLQHLHLLRTARPLHGRLVSHSSRKSYSAGDRWEAPGCSCRVFRRRIIGAERGPSVNFGGRRLRRSKNYLLCRRNPSLFIWQPMMDGREQKTAENAAYIIDCAMLTSVVYRRCITPITSQRRRFPLSNFHLFCCGVAVASACLLLGPIPYRCSGQPVLSRLCTLFRCFFHSSCNIFG